MIKFTSEESLLLENYSEDDYKYLLDEHCLESLDINESDPSHPESQKKLILAAKIGKFLLEKIRCLENELTSAKSLLESREQEINYLKQKLASNDAFIQNFSRTSGYDDDDNISSISSTENTSFRSDSGLLGPVSCATIDSLTRRIRELEDKNAKIKQEALEFSVKNQSQHLDEHDSTLVRDCLKQVKKYNENYEKLREELNGNIIANNNLYNQYLQLNSAKNELQNKLEHVQSENELMKYQLKDVFTSKEQLSIHYKNLYDKYDEIIILYNDCRKQLQETRRKLKKCIESKSPEDISDSILDLVDVEDYCGVEEFHLSSYLLANPRKNQSIHSDDSSISLANELEQSQTSSKSKLNEIDQKEKEVKRRLPSNSTPTNNKNASLLRPGNLTFNRSTSRRHSWVSDKTPEANAPNISSLAIESNDLGPIRSLVGSNLKKNLSVESLTNNETNETRTMISDEVTLCRNNQQKLLLVKPMSGSNVLQKWQRMATTASLLGVMPSSHKGITVRRDIHEPSVKFETKMTTPVRPMPKDSPPLQPSTSQTTDKIKESLQSESRPQKMPSYQQISNQSSYLSMSHIHALFNAFILGYPSTTARSNNILHNNAQQNQKSHDKESSVTPKMTRRRRVEPKFEDSTEETSSSSDSSRTKSFSLISTSSKGLLEAASLVKRPSLEKGKLNQLYEASLRTNSNVHTNNMRRLSEHNSTDNDDDVE